MQDAGGEAYSLPLDCIREHHNLFVDLFLMLTSITDIRQEIAEHLRIHLHCS